MDAAAEWCDNTMRMVPHRGVGTVCVCLCVSRHAISHKRSACRCVSPDYIVASCSVSVTVTVSVFVFCIKPGIIHDSAAFEGDNIIIIVPHNWHDVLAKVSNVIPSAQCCPTNLYVRLSLVCRRSRLRRRQRCRCESKKGHATRT